MTFLFSGVGLFILAGMQSSYSAQFAKAATQKSVARVENNSYQDAA